MTRNQPLQLVYEGQVISLRYVQLYHATIPITVPQEES